MGMTHVTIQVANAADGVRPKTVECLVDTGAFFSIIPKDVLRAVGVRARRKQTFTLANGHVIVRRVGDALFRYGKHEGAAPAIFGEKHDKALLGVLSIEAMGLEVDSVKKRLKPTELLLV